VTEDEAGRSEAAEIAAALGPAWRRATRGEPRWQPSVAVVVMLVLQVRLGEGLSPFSPWLLPALELVLLVVLVAVNPARIDRHQPALRAVSLALVALASLFNAGSVVVLVRGLIDGTLSGQASTLLAAGANVWITNVIVFGLWYWELDRGGPGARAEGRDPDPDFLFPQMSDSTGDYHHWEPQFVDYLYVACTNAMAFSPTDAMPLTRWAKLGMMLQSGISLVTAALIVARAVNVLV
jgi:uncharacterized membrane protein